MSDEQTEATEQTEVQEEVVDTVEDIVEDTPQEEAEATEEQDDIVAKALERQKELEAQLAELSDADANVFEKNAMLEAKVEEAKRLKEAEERNKELQGQLEAIKRETLVKGMMADGRLNKDLTEWAESLSFDQLQAYAEKAPKVKNILKEKNPVDSSTLDMEEWRKKMNKSRIIS